MAVGLLYALAGQADAISGASGKGERFVDCITHDSGEVSNFDRERKTWNSDPFGKIDVGPPAGPKSLLIRGVGFGINQRFANRMWDSVMAVSQSLREHPATTLDEAIAPLRLTRAQYALDSGDFQASKFGQDRIHPAAGDPPEIHATPLREKYLVPTRIAMQIIREGFASQRGPLLLIPDTHQPIHRTVFGTHRFRGEDKAEPAIIHLSAEDGRAAYEYCQRLFPKLLDPHLTDAQVFNGVADLHYWLAQAMPYARGSAAVSDALTKAVLQSHGIETGMWKPGVSPDVVAYGLSPQTFRQIYVSLFDRVEPAPVPSPRKKTPTKAVAAALAASAAVIAYCEKWGVSKASATPVQGSLPVICQSLGPSP